MISSERVDSMCRIYFAALRLEELLDDRFPGPLAQAFTFRAFGASVPLVEARKELGAIAR